MSGTDIITDYEVESDTIKLTTGTVGGSSLKGTDVILNIVNGKKAVGSITVKGMKNQALTVIDGSDASDTRLFGYYSYGETTETIVLNSDFSGTLSAESVEAGPYYASSVKVVDGSKVTKGAYIQGNGGNTMSGGSGNDTLVAGGSASSLYGGNGNDSLIGGEGDDILVGAAGNDTYVGGAGANTFVFTGGAEVIADYSAGEGNTISLSSGKVTASTIKNNDVVLTIGNKGSVTVKDAAYTPLHVVDSSGYEETRLFGYYTYDSATATINLNADFKGELVTETSTTNPYYDGNVKAINAGSVNNMLTINGTSNVTKITAGKKSTTINGGAAAFTTLIGGAAADVINGNTGIDSINGGAGNDVLYGDAGNDYLDGGNGNDSLSGGAGNDVLIANTGNDTLTGGEGNDIFVYNGGADIISDYVSGQDTISISSGSVTASTISGGNVVLTIGNKGSITVLNAKNQELKVATPNSTVTGIFGYYSGVGTKSIKLNAGFTGTLYATAKMNTIYGSSGDDTISGGLDGDLIFGTSGNNVLLGETGDDTLVSGNVANTLTGGVGNDIFIHGSDTSADIITDYEVGKDKIILSNTSVLSSAVNGNDVILNVTTDGNDANAGTITIVGGKDQTITLEEYDGSNQVKTEGIFGYYSYEKNENNKVTGITLNAEFSETLDTAKYSSSVATIDATNVESDVVIFGNANANTILGSTKAEKETIYGGDGADSILGSTGDNVLFGDAGNDTILGNSGDDYISGGEGNDSIDAGEGDNTLYGGAGNDTLISGSGEDLIYGDEGNDSLLGGSGNNSLYGGAGNDTLQVTAGDNYLDGGEGNDSLIGGSGTDTFFGGDGNDTLVHTGGNDIIVNYTNNTKESDVIMLAEGSSVESSELNGNDVILNVKDSEDKASTITIQNAKNNAIKVGTYQSGSPVVEELIYGYYLFDSVTDPSNPSITLNADFEGTLADSLYPANVTNIDATKVNTASTDPVVIYGNSKNNNILGATIMPNVVYGATGADSITGGNDADSLYGGAGADSLFGSSGDDFLSGGDGNDTLEGGSGDDTLEGGIGNDVFIYLEGEDLISDYEASKDIIRYDADAMSLKSSAITGNDVVLTFNNGTRDGSITLTDAKDKRIILTDLTSNVDSTVKGDIYGYYDGVGTNEVTLNSDYSESTFTAKNFNSAITLIDASKLEEGKNIAITGTDQASTIIGSTNNDTG